MPRQHTQSIHPHAGVPLHRLARGIPGQSTPEHTLPSSSGHSREQPIAHDIQWSAARDGTVRAISPALLRWLGMDEATYREGGWLDRVHPPARARVERRLARGFAGDHAFTVEYALRGADGTYRALRCMARPTGDHAGWEGTIIDDTAHRRYEEHQRFVQRCRVELREARTLERGVARAAELLVPTLCDWALIQVPSDGKTVRCSVARDGTGPRITHGTPFDDTRGLHAALREAGHELPPDEDSAIVRLPLGGARASGSLSITLVNPDRAVLGLVAEAAQVLGAALGEIRRTQGREHSRARTVRSLRAAVHLAELQAAVENLSSRWEVGHRVAALLVRETRALAVSVLWPTETGRLSGVRFVDDGVCVKVGGAAAIECAVTEALKRGEEIHLASGEDHRGRYPLPTPYLSYLGSALVVPLRSEGRVIGCLTAEWAPDFERKSAAAHVRDAAGLAARALQRVGDAREEGPDTPEPLLPLHPPRLVDARLVELTLDALPQRVLLSRVQEGSASLLVANAAARGSPVVRQALPGAPMASVLSPSVQARWESACWRAQEGQGQAWFDDGGVPMRLIPLRFSGGALHILTIIHGGHGAGQGAAASPPTPSEPGTHAGPQHSGMMRLSSGLAHHLNNLLTVVTGHAWLGLEGAPPGSPPAQGLQEILRAADRAGLLVQQMLAFAHQQHGVPGRVELRRVLIRVADLLHPLVHDLVRVVLDIPPDLPDVHADGVQVEQLVLNLALHANESMRHGGVLSISASNVDVQRTGECPPIDTRQGVVRIDVADTGGGSGPRELQAAPFEGDAAMFPLGLSVAAASALIEELHGAVVVYRKPGQGSVFRVYIPVAPPGHTPRDLAQEGRAIAGSVMVVDDEKAVRTLAATVLRQDGYEVIEQDNGADALAALHGRKVDLLITDIMMPGMDGRELAEEAVQLHPGMRVLLMSGHFDEGSVARTGFRMLGKPFTPSALRAAVRAVMAPTAPHATIQPRPIRGSVDG